MEYLDWGLDGWRIEESTKQEAHDAVWLVGLRVIWSLSNILWIQYNSILHLASGGIVGVIPLFSPWPLDDISIVADWVLVHLSFLQLGALLELYPFSGVFLIL